MSVANHLASVSVGLLAVSISVCLSFLTPICAFGDDASDAGIAQLETHFFLHDFGRDPTGDRLNRLEEMVFGQTQSGSNEQRLAKLLAMLPKSDANTAPNSGSIADNDSQKAAAPSSAEPLAPGSDLQPADGNANNPPADEVSNVPPPESSKYPAVTAIESQYFGKTFESQAVDKRLDRLETKLFGKPRGGILADRVDKLKAQTGIDVAQQAPNARDWNDNSDEAMSSSSVPSNSHSVDTEAGNTTPFVDSSGPGNNDASQSAPLTSAPEQSSPQPSANSTQYRNSASLSALPGTAPMRAPRPKNSGPFKDRNAVASSSPEPTPARVPATPSDNSGKLANDNQSDPAMKPADTTAKLADSQGPRTAGRHPGRSGSATNDVGPPVAPPQNIASAAPPVAAPPIAYSASSFSPAMSSLGLVPRIEALEEQVLGKVYLDTLSNRLARLEQRVFPQQLPDTGGSLPDRVQRLTAAVVMSGAGRPIAQQN